MMVAHASPEILGTTRRPRYAQAAKLLVRQVSASYIQRVEALPDAAPRNLLLGGRGGWSNVLPRRS